MHTRYITAFVAVFMALIFSGKGLAQEDMELNLDPWQGVNRTVFGFNETLDTIALKPLTLGYKAVMPDIAEQGVSNFFANIADVNTLVNNLLQGKFDRAVSDMARISFNTTIGLAGFIDVATPMGIEKNHEDFGQTLGYWGVESGPYVVLPFFGPSSVRDGVGQVADIILDPETHVDHVDTRNELYFTHLIDKRSQLLSAEELISGDRYVFIREAYLQKREFEVQDGVIEDYDDSNF